MELYKLMRDGKMTLINGDNILIIDYEEQEQKLAVRFINGETITLSGSDATSAWELFKDEAITNDHNEEAETEGEDEEEDEDQFESINREISVLELQVQRGSVTRIWDAHSLRRSADELDEYWNAKEKRKYKDELKAVRERAYAVADEAETVALTNRIDECARKPIVNNSSVKSILGQLNEAENELKKGRKLTDELRGKIRNAKERVAWHRTKKKLSDAEVALAGGNPAKADKCRREASTTIKQDWAEVFPNEEPPEIEARVE